MIYQYQVSELVNNLKLTLGEIFPIFDIVGEVSSVSLNQKSGHLYFTIKDKDSSINCACWKSNFYKMKDFIKEGEIVKIRGKISLFNNGTKIYINALEAKPEGEGNIQKYILELKQKLAHLGYFEEANKKIIPNFPNSIGLITSLDGAVIADIKTTMTSRFPTKTYLINVPVQGIDSIAEIIKAIKKFNKLATPPQVLIIARGGGSEEDLFHFNNEKLIKTIYDSEIPIITAIGHQPNSTLADLVADLSVATPTASVHFLPEINLIKKSIDALQQQLKKNSQDILYNLELLVNSKKTSNLLLKNTIDFYNNKLNHYQQNIYNLAKSKIIKLQNNIINYNHNYNAMLLKNINDNNFKVYNTKQNLKNPNRMIANYANSLLVKSNRIDSIYYNIQFYENKLQATLRLLENLSFKKNLKRGYSIIFNSNSQIITSTEQLVADHYSIELQDGKKKVKIIPDK